MSPAKKKTTKKKTAAKKKTAKKKVAKKPAGKKTTKKKVAKKTTKKTTKKKVAKKAAATAKGGAKGKKKAPAKKDARKTTAAKAAGKAGKKATTEKATGKKKAGGKGKKEAAAKPVPKGKPIPISDIPHPKYGFKFECFACETKFYLMGKPEPLCPKCGADQRERPKDPPKDSPKPKRPAVRPMAPLLDDDEEVAAPDDLDDGKVREPAEPDAMFDDAEVASVADETETETRPAAPAADDD